MKTKLSHSYPLIYKTIEMRTVKTYTLKTERFYKNSSRFADFDGNLNI